MLNEIATINSDIASYVVIEANKYKTYNMWDWMNLNNGYSDEYVMMSFSLTSTQERVNDLIALKPAQ